MITKKNINNIFLIFLITHLIIWVLAPTLSNPNLPLDTIEALAWGSDLDWGYNKHPPMSAFVVEIFYLIFGNQDWAYYFLSQIFVLLAFFIIWRFSQDFFKNQISILFSVIVLELIYFYNYTTPEFNVYICQLPFWALTVYFSWKGIKDNKTQDWLLLGLFAALGVLSHYLFFYLLASISLFIIYLQINKKLNYKCFRSFFVFLIILAPHFFWLVENNFATFNYAFHRTGFEEIVFFNHIIHPLTFFVKQLGILLPFFIIFLFLFLKFKIEFNLKDKKLLFLLSINIFPILLIFLTSLIMGVKIRTMWMTPFYIFSGVLFVYLLQKKIDFKKINKIILSYLILFILSPSIYLYVSISQTNKRTDYPGKEIARLVQQKWDKNFRNEIKIVIGDEWFAGNLSYHLNSRPKWTSSLKSKISEIESNQGVIYTGNPVILKKVCPGVFGTIKPVGYCMIGQK